MTNLFGNILGYKINLEKSVVFLYTNNKHTDNSGTLPLTITPKYTKE